MAAPRYITSTSGVLTEVAAAETGPASTPAEQIVSTNSAGLVDATLLPASATIPAGGTTGQALTKNSGTDYDTGWTGPYVHLAGDTMTGQLGFPNGSASAPSAFFNTNYGLFYDATNSALAISAGGIEQIFVSNNGISNPDALTANIFLGIQPKAFAIGYAPTSFPSGSFFGPSIGVLAPADPGGATALNAFNVVSQITGNNNSSSNVAASYFAYNASTGTVGTMVGFKATARTTAGGTTTSAVAAQFSLQSTNASSTPTGTVLQITIPSTTGSGTIGTLNAISIAAQKITGVTTTYAIAQSGASDNNYFAGPVLIGGTLLPAASAALEIKSTTGALLIPRMTTTQRNALTASNGMLVYDTTVAAFFHYTNSAWVQLSLLHSPYSKQVPATGFSITIAAGVNYLILDPAGTLATGTVTMDASPIDGQEVTISSSQVITALTISANTGQSIIGAATTFAANGFAKYKYVVANTTWYRVG